MNRSEIERRPQSALDYLTLPEQVIDILKHSKTDIIIFGVQGMGVSIFQALVKLGLHAACYCDNSPPDSKMELNNLSCITPFEAVQRYPNAVYIFSAIEPSTCWSMHEQLKKLNSNVFGLYWDIFYFEYATKLREADKSKFAETLWCFWDSHKKDKKILIHSLSHRITNRCTLKCKDCAFLVPYQHEYNDFPLSGLLSELEALCTHTDGILDLTINGGETLLFSDLAAYIQGVSKISNIINMVIITNGTVVPSDETMKICSDNAVRIRVSDYGGFSDKIDDLFEKCTRFGVSISFYRHVDNWCNIGVTKHNRSDEENRKIADNCPFNGGKNRRVLGLYKGGVHICDRFDGLYACGYIDDASFNKLHCDVFTADRITLKTHLSGASLYKQCDMCNWPMNQILPGIQLI